MDFIRSLSVIFIYLSSIQFSWTSTSYGYRDDGPSSGGHAGPSYTVMPTHGESTALIYSQDDADFAQYGGEPPPEFTYYDAQHWVKSNGDIVSHDPHLNEDGTSRYLLLLAICSLYGFLNLECVQANEP